MAEKLEVEIDANVGGSAETKQLADAVAQVGDALRGLVSDAKGAVSTLDKIERNIAGASKASNGAISGVNGLAEAYKKLNKSIPAGDFTNGQYTGNGGSKLASTGRGADSSVGVISTKQSREATAATEAARAAVAKMDAAYKAEKDARRQAVLEMRAERIARETNTKVTNEQTYAITRQNSAFNQARPNIEQYHASLQQAGYGLTNVSFSLGLVGAAILASTGASIKAAADYETAMAQISRTSGIGGQGLEVLRGQFVELAQTIPASFQELSQIGTLAGQLNVPAEKIAAFTETTAKFSATTNVTAEAAATAFGRLDALLPDVKGNYEALGSAILTVGVNSVATETEIIATTSQIAAAGAQAGFTADQVIGLAASYASLGVAPEAARGTTIRVFSEIRTAINQGGSALDEFAKLSGMSAEEFKKAWTADAGETFITILEGLQREGSGAEDVLRGLGITAVRDINSLLKLSQNAEIVGDNFAYAADGMSRQTQLQDAFAVQAATLASKLEMLANSVQALFAQLGQSGLGPLGGFVDLIKDAVVGLTDLASNPVVQWTAALTTGIAALVGISILLAAVLARVGGGALIARNAIRDLSVAATEAGGGLRGLTVAMAGTTFGAKALRGALISTGIGALVVLLGSGIAALDSFANSQEKVFGTGEDLASALAADTAEFKKTGDRIGTVDGQIKTVTTTTKDWVGVVQQQTGGVVALSDATQNTTEDIDAMTFSIGKQTAALISNKLANDTRIKSLYERNGKIAETGLPTLDTGGVITAAARNDVAGATKIIDDYKKILDDLKGPALDPAAYNQATQQITEARLVIKDTTGALRDAAVQTQINNDVNTALGITTQDAAGGVGMLGAEAEEAAPAIRDFGAEVKAAFGESNAVSSFAQDFFTLIDGIKSEGYTAFDPWNEGGQANLQNLQSAIASSIASAETLGIDSTEAVALVFKQLQAAGVDTAKLLASLGGMSIPGVSVAGVGDYLKGTKEFSGAGNDLNKTLGQISNNAGKSANNINKVGRASSAAAKEVRTFVDYASDLGSVFDRAFDLRFGNMQALDKISTGWRNIAEASAAAAKSISDAQVELQKLTSDKAIQEYFLSVAEDYGDTLRAGEIRAKLAEINAKIAAEQNNLTKAQQEGSKTLVGNSQAAIENRATILGMVGSYQEYLQQLASSGVSQAYLEQKAKQLRAEFLAQAKQLGFNSGEVAKYAKSFNDMSTIITKVPRNVTVNANINPALLALKEFEAKAKKSGAAAGQGYGQSFSNAWVAAYNKSENDRIRKEIARLSKIKGANAEGLANKIQALRAQLIPGYAQGGYTGNGGTSSVAGVVHGKEFVVNAQATAQPGVRALLTALNNGSRIGSASTSSAAAGSGIMMVELVTYDRQLLMDIRDNIGITISPTAVATVVGQQNTKSYGRGA